MAFSRYRNVGTVYNDTDEHEDLRKRRGVSSLKHHRSVRVQEMPEAVLRRLVHKFHVWKQSDRFWKLSTKYYNDPGYWWVIARFNQTPTESHLENGDTLLIPLPLPVALRAMGY